MMLGSRIQFFFFPHSTRFFLLAMYCCLFAWIESDAFQGGYLGTKMAYIIQKDMLVYAVC